MSNARALIAAVLTCTACATSPASADPPSSPEPPSPAIGGTREPASPAENGEDVDPPSVEDSERRLGELQQLTPDAVAAAVLAVNPGLVGLRAAVRAARADVRVAGGATDPTLTWSIAPGALASGFYQMLEVRWSFPWPGTRDAREQAAEAEVEGEVTEVEALRRELAVEARSLVLTLGAIARSRALVDAHDALIATLEVSLGRGIEAARANLTRADNELQRIAIDRAERFAKVALNALLHRPADAPLPAAAPLAALPKRPPELLALIDAAVDARPEVMAAQARARARQSDIRVVEKESLPMLGVGASFNTMWDDPAMWGTVMVMIDLPLATGRREGLADRARARVLQAEAELDLVRDAVMRDIAEKRLELVAALDSAATIEARVLPSAETAWELAVAGIVGGRVSFAEALEAADMLITARTTWLAWQRDAWIADARLAAAIGGAP